MTKLTTTIEQSIEVCKKRSKQSKSYRIAGMISEQKEILFLDAATRLEKLKELANMVLPDTETEDEMKQGYEIGQDEFQAKLREIL